MGLLSDYKGNVRFWLKGYLFLGVAILTLAMLIYSNHLIGRMSDQAEATSRLFSRYISNVLFEVADDSSLVDLKKVVKESQLPIIITVLGGKPILWSHVPVDERTEEDFQTLVNMDVNNPPTPKLRKLVELYRQFDKINTPIPVRVVGAQGPQGYVHYGPSSLERELRYMPFIELGIFLVFMGVAIQGIRYLKLSEERSIWVGMAKETAHQLGTPLSALLGWTQLIKDHAREQNCGEIEESVAEMEIDLGRLSKISDRFSKIGSQPELRPVDVRAVLERTVAYFHRRLPRLRSDSTLVLEPGGAPPIRGNEELLEWVFENLIKNGLDALGDGGGTITIAVQHEPGSDEVDILVRDTGRGIPTGLRERIFRPGFSTKRRGWGLGLALTRRIVRDYHNGTIRLAESRPGHGTTFVVRLPVA